MMQYEVDGYEVRLARADEMEAIQRLRYDIFCAEMGFLDPKEYPDGRESDRYDTQSDHMVILREGRIVSYARFILPRELPFLMEETVTLPAVFDRQRTVEVSRGFIVSEERRSGLKDILLDAVCRYCREGGYGYLLSFSNSVMFENWKKRGVDFVHIGEKIRHRGYDSWPLVIRIG